MYLVILWCKRNIAITSAANSSSMKTYKYLHIKGNMARSVIRNFLIRHDVKKILDFISIIWSNLQSRWYNLEMDELDQARVVVDYMVRGLVDQPEAVKISAILSDGGARYCVVVAPTDLIKVIGIRGATARSLRVVLGAIGDKINRQLSLEIKE
jgi:predicted RNA-binding protein YlqC (UPF0109 family)